jgi:hypothetical protein
MDLPTYSDQLHANDEFFCGICGYPKSGQCKTTNATIQCSHCLVEAHYDCCRHAKEHLPALDLTSVSSTWICSCCRSKIDDRQIDEHACSSANMSSDKKNCAYDCLFCDSALLRHSPKLHMTKTKSGLWVSVLHCSRTLN